MSLSKVIEIARGELGVTENPPGSNIQKYGAEYGLNAAPWCMIFLWWCFSHAGEKAAFFGGAKTASCGTLLRWYREQGLTVPVEQVQAGDIVILNFHGTKDTEHCGLVVGVNYHQAGGWKTSVQTIEGNTTPGEEGSQDNGGCVALKTRWGNQIVAVCRPQYKPEETYPRDDVTGHWAESAIRRVIKRGIMVGYTDGSFQPDKSVTRAELATVLDRMDKEDDLR